MLQKSFIQKTFSSIKPWHALAALIFANILIGIFIGRNFGESWDETIYYIYGEKSLDAYLRGLAGLQLIPEKHILLANLRYYGPFYAVIGKLTADTLTKLLTAWSYEDIWHLVNFIFFQAGLISLYIVAKRFMSEWAAFGTVLLLSTQPLIFGHAFINPKDIPFMSFFIASIASGLIMIEAGVEKPEQPSDKGFPYSLIFATLFGLYTLSIIGKDVASSLTGNLITFIYHSRPESFFGRLFSLFSDPNTRLPVENYIHKAVNSKLDQTLIGLLLLITAAKWIFDQYQRRQKTGIALHIDLSFAIKILIAGTILGVTTSVRLLGPFAGLLVAGYAISMMGKRSIPVTIYYFSIAALTAYLTWPFLWDLPVQHFINSLDVMKDFPFEGTIRFMGNNYAADNLPWSYIPALIAVQLTEPVIVLSIIGFLGAAWTFIKNPGENKKIILILAWLLIPIGLFIILHSSAYDNFRQVFFVLPPIFILAGIALDWIFKRISNSQWRLALITLMLLPGIIGIAAWHPYEYIYYNSFVGGVSGAADDFEMDYWMTSYREATYYLNENAPEGAKILVMFAGFNVDHNARKDLVVESYNPEKATQGGYDYIVISTRYDAHLSYLPDAEIVYEVRKNGVLLAVVKKLPK